MRREKEAKRQRSHQGAEEQGKRMQLEAGPRLQATKLPLIPADMFPGSWGQWKLTSRLVLLAVGQECLSSKDCWL